MTGTGRNYLEKQKQLTDSVTESVPLPWKAWKTQGGKGREKGKETLANLEGNPETAALLQRTITARQKIHRESARPLRPSSQTDA